MKALAMAGLLLLAMCAACFAGDEIYEFTGDIAKSAENTLAWMVSNPQGEARDAKTAYIVGGLRCPYTRDLIKKSVAMSDCVQLKWIFPYDSTFSVPGTGYLITDPLPEGFIRLGKEKIPDTPEQEILARFNALLYAELLSGKVGYPAIFYNTKKGFHTTARAENLINEKDDIIPFTVPERDNKQLVLDAYQKELTKKVRAENSSKEVMHAHALPDAASPILANLGLSLEPGHYREAPCFEYDAEFLVCLMNDGQTRYFLKKNQ